MDLTEPRPTPPAALTGPTEPSPNPPRFARWLVCLALPGLAVQVVALTFIAGIVAQRWSGPAPANAKQELPAELVKRIPALDPAFIELLSRATPPGRPRGAGPADSTPGARGGGVRPGLQAPLEVPAVRTPLSSTEAARALKAAWTERYGWPPKRETLAILTAQWAHETGHGRAMYNYNFGGLKGAGPGNRTALRQTREGFGASARRLGDYFRAYSTAEEGALDYLSVLEERFDDALGAAERGEAEAFVEALKDHGYFTGNPALYTRNVAALTRIALEQGFEALDLPI